MLDIVKYSGDICIIFTTQSVISNAISYMTFL